ncbi:hypothetical protein L208DRAFT_1297992, partial [Tricholoma matsutake]
ERLLAECKLVQKLDTRLLPTVIIISLMNYLDHNGITMAHLQGMEQDLRLTGIHSISLPRFTAVLYASYCPAQIPSNMVGCQLIDTAQVTKDFPGIVACRVFIGLPEAAFYLGSIYLLSRWYTKKVRHANKMIQRVSLILNFYTGAGFPVCCPLCWPPYFECIWLCGGIFSSNLLHLDFIYFLS